MKLMPTHANVSKLRLTIICKIEIINPILKEKIYNFTELINQLSICKIQLQNNFNKTSVITHWSTGISFGRKDAMF